MPTTAEKPTEKILSQPTDSTIEHQRSLFSQGTRYVKLLRPAKVKGGIIRLSDSQRKAAVARYDKANGIKVAKFVPASGAASRMFSRIQEWIKSPDAHKKSIQQFFGRVEGFPFFEEWVAAADKADVETFESGLDSKVRWLQLLLGEEGLNYASIPKGLIKFHLYDEPVTPVYEHLKEAMGYASVNGKAQVEFTVSPEHEEAFKAEVDHWLNREPFIAVEWQVTFSNQDPATDTVAVDESNEVVMQNGSPVMRPGGHGALIHNLNDVNADLVFVKNIDNVAHERMLPTTVEYKKALAGVLLELRSDLSNLNENLGKGLLDETHVQELRDKWNIRIPKDYQKLKAYLERPIRVCGMVKNEGEPGGGPFWALDKFTGESLQIVEQAQVDPKDSRQQMIAGSAEYFNPVDIVCFKKNFENQTIDLTAFVDDDLYFVANKSWNGQQIKALEWPGLWNGGMAHWITLFVEVPIETFNPVKEISDLWRAPHQSE